MIVQIYEIQTPREAATMIKLGVDHVGSVITSKENWRLETIKAAVKETRKLGGKSSLIPLYCDAEAVFRTLDYYQPDIVHFCETIPDTDDDPVRVEQLFDLQEKTKDRFSQIRIMRSIPIHEAGKGDLENTLNIARLFEPVTDYFLTDTLLADHCKAQDDQQPVNGFVGITGITCDWDIASQLVKSSKIPVILAGGISPDNVYDGIRQVHPAGVDSCTLTNAVDPNGVPVRFTKNENLVRQFVQEAKKAN